MKRRLPTRVSSKTNKRIDMIAMTPLSCSNCGAPINRSIMRCPYCRSEIFSKDVEQTDALRRQAAATERIARLVQLPELKRCERELATKYKALQEQADDAQSFITEIEQ